MLIVIPTYKRNECLRWVVKSVYQCDVASISEAKNIVVVNNHPPSRQTVDHIASEFKKNAKFDCRICHRTETLPAIDSWFSAIAEYANEDEVVVLLGDDDLMMPWGLRDRHREILASKADMLLSDFADRIFFFERCEKYWMTGKMPIYEDQERTACSWDFFPAKHPEASFVSNHCYRNTANFRRGLELAFSWCESQSWLERKVRMGMLPFYLPYAITLAGGKVVSLHSKSVLRGALADEAIRSTYADGGNVTFYNLCAYDVLSNRTLRMHNAKLERANVRFKEDIVREFLSMFIDKNITWKMLKPTIRHSKFSWTDLLSPKAFKGIFTILIKLTGLRGLRLRIMRHSSTLSLTESLFK